jgi:hypothetical protein
VVQWGVWKLDGDVMWCRVVGQVPGEGLVLSGDDLSQANGGAMS